MNGQVFLACTSFDSAMYAVKYGTSRRQGGTFDQKPLTAIPNSTSLIA